MTSGWSFGEPELQYLLAPFLVLALSSWIGIVLSHQSEGVATIWFSNGILFGLVMTRPRNQWLRYFVAGLLADTLADVVFGDPFRVAIGVSLANSFEVIASCMLLTRRFGTPFDLSRSRPLVGFLLVSVLGVAAVSSAMGATWTLLFFPGVPWWRMWRTWYLGDVLGLALMGPLVFTLRQPGFFAVLRRRELPHTLGILLVPAVAAVLVFTHSRDPLLFFLVPALLLVVFRLGFPGTVMAVILVAVLSIGLTVKGFGPLMLIAGEHMMLHRIVVLQIFLAVSIFTMFPVAALLAERAELQRSLETSEARQRQLALEDDLTGLANRRAFNLRLEEEWLQAQREATTLALLLLDADHFKRYNDRYGHVSGDECLREIAATLSSVVRGAAEGDADVFAARFGGEEFAVILPGWSVEQARVLAERVRQAIAERTLVHEGSPNGVQTVSLGVAGMTGPAGHEALMLVRMADAALYSAKETGRNRVAVAERALASFAGGGKTVSTGSDRP